MSSTNTELKEPEIVLGDLLNLASHHPRALKVFSAFKIEAKYEKNLEVLRKLSCPELEEAAELLGAVPLVGGNKRYKNRTTLAEWIIMRIEALYPYRCGTCKELYQVERLATPLRRCHNCGMGSHDCEEFQKAVKTLQGTLMGQVWLCDVCFSNDRLEAFPDNSIDEEAMTESDDEFEDRITPPKAKTVRRKRRSMQQAKGNDIVTPVSEDPPNGGRPNKLSLSIVEDPVGEMKILLKK